MYLGRKCDSITDLLLLGIEAEQKISPGAVALAGFSFQAPTQGSTLFLGKLLMNPNSYFFVFYLC